jgi:hypothetical protein
MHGLDVGAARRADLPADPHRETGVTAAARPGGPAQLLADRPALTRLIAERPAPSTFGRPARRRHPGGRNRRDPCVDG